MSTTLSNASSNFELHWVKPTLPTALNGREFLPLPSSDLIFFATELTWLVPGLLDICRLKEALSLTLRDFPHFCGLLSLDENTKSRRLLLSNKPVRLTVGKNTTVELTDEVMNESHPDIADTLPIAFQASEEIAREPLVRFRVTEWTMTGETTITITCCHLLTDGPGEIHFFNTWSAYYTQQTPPPAPTFEKFLDAPPSCPRNRITSTLSAVSLLAIDYPAEELIKMNMPRFAATERVELGFTKKQLEKLKRKANKSTGETTLSTMDALAGYLATILNRVDDAPVQEINHVIGYRGASAVSDGSYKPPPLTSTGNVVITIQSPRIEATRSTPLGPYAQLLRSSVRRSLSPDNLRDIVGLSEELYTRAYETKRYADYGLHAGNMGLSSLYKTLVHRAHFGFEGQVRFYSNTTFERYFRVLPANPVKHVDNAGIVHWENREGGATVLFRVRKGLCEKVLALVKEDMANLQCAASKL